MSTDELSRTALLVAGYRALGHARTPRWCDDPWADAIAGEDGKALATLYADMMPDLAPGFAVRTQLIDEIARARPAEQTQVVLLGAGLDARAARLQALGTTFFEVDRAATLEGK